MRIWRRHGPVASQTRSILSYKTIIYNPTLRWPCPSHSVTLTSYISAVSPISPTARPLCCAANTLLRFEPIGVGRSIAAADEVHGVVMRVGEESLDLGHFKGFLCSFLRSFLRRLFNCGGGLNGRLDPTSQDDSQHLWDRDLLLGMATGPRRYRPEPGCWRLSETSLSSKDFFGVSLVRYWTAYARL
jgi:hypothetical protein